MFILVEKQKNNLKKNFWPFLEELLTAPYLTCSIEINFILYSPLKLTFKSLTIKTGVYRYVNFGHKLFQFFSHHFSPVHVFSDFLHRFFWHHSYTNWISTHLNDFAIFNMCFIYFMLIRILFWTFSFRFSVKKFLWDFNLCQIYMSLVHL
jgi:hypothetical protein